MLTLSISCRKCQKWFYTLHVIWKTSAILTKQCICKEHTQIKSKVKSKVQKSVKRNSKSYFSIHKEVFFIFASARRGKCPVPQQTAGLSRALTMLHCFFPPQHLFPPLSAPQKLCQQLHKPCQKLLNLIQHKYCNHFPSCLLFWESHPCNLSSLIPSIFYLELQPHLLYLLSHTSARGVCLACNDSPVGFHK